MLWYIWGLHGCLYGANVSIIVCDFWGVFTTLPVCIYNFFVFITDPEYNGKTKNTNSHTPNPNDRYSNQSYDSVGSISGYSNYSDSTAAGKKFKEPTLCFFF